MKKARDKAEGHRRGRTDKMFRSRSSARDLDEAKERKAGSRAEGLAWLRASVAYKLQGGPRAQEAISPPMALWSQQVTRG